MPEKLIFGLKELPMKLKAESITGTQNSQVLSHLQERGSITPLEALIVYRIFRLAARVYDLRVKGWNIETRIKRDRTGKTYAQYRLK